MSYLPRETYESWLRQATGFEQMDVQVHAFSDVHRFVHCRLEELDVFVGPAISLFHLSQRLPSYLRAVDPVLSTRIAVLRDLQHSFHTLEAAVLQDVDPIKAMQRVLHTEEKPLVFDGDPFPGIKHMFATERAILAERVFKIPPHIVRKRGITPLLTIVPRTQAVQR